MRSDDLHYLKYVGGDGFPVLIDDALLFTNSLRGSRDDEGSLDMVLGEQDTLWSDKERPHPFTTAGDGDAFPYRHRLQAGLAPIPTIGELLHEGHAAP